MWCSLADLFVHRSSLHLLYCSFRAPSIKSCLHNLRLLLMSLTMSQNRNISLVAPQLRRDSLINTSRQRNTLTHTRIHRYTATAYCGNPAIAAPGWGLEVLMLISIALSEPTLCHAFATMNQVQHLQPPGCHHRKICHRWSWFAYQTEDLVCHSPLICCEKYARTFYKIINVTITALLIYSRLIGGIPNDSRQKCFKSVRLSVSVTLWKALSQHLSWLSH